MVQTCRLGKELEEATYLDPNRRSMLETTFFEAQKDSAKAERAQNYFNESNFRFSVKNSLVSNQQ